MGRAGNINFVGWGDCAPSSTGVRITSGSESVTDYIGRSDQLALMTLDFSCSRNGLTREECIKIVALHEFGHVLGYAHEQNRPDKPIACDPQGNKGTETFGAWDGRSIMNYCPINVNLSPLDRRGTDRYYGQAYADTSHLGLVQRLVRPHRRRAPLKRLGGGGGVP